MRNNGFDRTYYLYYADNLNDFFNTHINSFSLNANTKTVNVKINS